MDQKVKDFIFSQHILSLSVCDKDGVYSASCFYVFDEKSLSLVIKSNPKSKHILLAQENPKIAVTIAVNTRKIYLIKGIQAKASFEKANDQQKNIYYQEYPFARLVNGENYSLRICWLKYTDNSFLSKRKLEYRFDI